MAFPFELAQQVVDEQFYRNNNPDVDTAISNGSFDNGADHFAAFGVAENRIPNKALEFFNPESYLENNNDIANAVNNGVFESALSHFIQFGLAENRQGKGFKFTEARYLSENPDVADAVQSGQFETGLQHFIWFGFDEDRSGVEIVPPLPGPPDAPDAPDAPGDDFEADETLQLTPGTDELTGESGNTLFRAPLASDGVEGIVNTLNEADVLDGGDGQNRLEATLVEEDVSPTISSVQEIFLRGRAQPADNPQSGLGADNITGVEEIWSRRSSSKLEVTAVQEPVTVGLENPLRNSADYRLEFTESAVEEANGEINAVIKSARATDAVFEISDETQGGGIETLNLESTDGVSELNALLTGNDLTTVNVTGNGGLKINQPINNDPRENRDLENNIETFDASGLDGPITINFSNSQVNKNITGSQGDSRFELGQTGSSNDRNRNIEVNLTANDSIDGGSGNNLVSATLVSSIADPIELNNIQTLELTSDLATSREALNLSQAPQLEEVIIEPVQENIGNPVGEIILNQIKPGVDIELQGTGNNNDTNLQILDPFTYSPKSSGDSVDLSVNNNGTPVNQLEITDGENGLNFPNMDTLNLEYQDGNLSIPNGIDGGLSTINVSDISDQQQGLDFNTTINANNLSDFNASDVTGNLSIRFNTNSDLTVRAGSGNDSITVEGGNNNTILAGKGADQITGGSGKDTFVYRSWRESSVDNTNVINQFDTPNQGDVIRLQEISGLADEGALNQLENVDKVEDSNNIGDWAFTNGIFTIQTTANADQFLQLNLPGSEFDTSQDNSDSIEVV